MDKITLRHLKKQFRKGKGTLANAADVLLIWLFVFVLMCSALWNSDVSLLACALLSGALASALLVIFSAVRKNRFARYLEKIRQETAEKLMLEKLMLLSTAKLSDIGKKVFEGVLGASQVTPAKGGFMRRDGIFCYVFFNHPDADVDLRQMFCAMRLARDAEAAKLCTLSPSNYTEDAVAFAHRTDAVILGRAELLQYAEKPTEEEIAEELRNAAHRANSKTDLKKRFLDKAKTRSYILCALLTTLWPLIFGFNIIYPLMAVFAWGLAFFSMRAHKGSDKSPSGSV